MMENIITYIVHKGINKMKLRDYLSLELKLSTRFIRRSGKEARIKVNGSFAKLNFPLTAGDKIDIRLDREESQDIEPQRMDIDVVYEDSDLIVVNKSPGMVVHPTHNYQLNTLTNGLLYYFKEKNENCIVRLVSRLDMDTSGLVIIAKNQFSHMSLARDMHDNPDFEKSYLAVVHGKLKEDCGVIDAPIQRGSESSIKREVHEEGQRSVTRFSVLENYSTGQLVKLTLETGRTHQIRVHLSSIGNPIYGDTLYGTEDDSSFIERQALHAYKLSFIHPRTKEKINLETPLPEDIKKLIEKIK